METFRYQTSVQEWEKLRNCWKKIEAQIESVEDLKECITLLNTKLFDVPNNINTGSTGNNTRKATVTSIDSSETAKTVRTTATFTANVDIDEISDSMNEIEIESEINNQADNDSQINIIYKKEESMTRMLANLVKLQFIFVCAYILHGCD